MDQWLSWLKDEGWNIRESSNYLFKNNEKFYERQFIRSPSNEN